MQPPAQMVRERFSDVGVEFAKEISLLAGDDPSLSSGFHKSAVQGISGPNPAKFADQQNDAVEMSDIIAEHIRQHGADA